MEPFPPITNDFIKFIRGLLKIGGLKKDHLVSFTNKESMKIFRIAFTHPSYSLDFNYEDFEFGGDLTLNLCVGRYIKNRYPDIINVNWKSRMKHTLVSKKYLGLMAERHGFAKHFAFNIENMRKRRGPGKYTVMSEEVKKERERQQFLDMMEDTLEAFFGAIEEVAELHKLHFGVVDIAISKNIVFKFLDELKIDAYDYTLYFDPITRLKEIHDSHGWIFSNAVKHYQNPETGEHTITFKTYPLGNKAPVRRNLIEYIAKGYDKQKTKAEAAVKALKGLDKVYGIKGKIPDPRARNIWKPKYENY